MSPGQKQRWTVCLQRQVGKMLELLVSCVPGETLATMSLAVLVELRVPLFWVSSFLTHHVPR